MVAISFVMSANTAPGISFLIAKILLLFLCRAFQTSPNWLQQSRTRVSEGRKDRGSVFVCESASHCGLYEAGASYWPCVGE